MVSFRRYNHITGQLTELYDYYDWPSALSALTTKRLALLSEGFSITKHSRTSFDAYSPSARFSYYLIPD